MTFAGTGGNIFKRAWIAFCVLWAVLWLLIADGHGGVIMQRDLYIIAALPAPALWMARLIGGWIVQGRLRLPPLF